MKKCINFLFFIILLISNSVYSGEIIASYPVFLSDRFSFTVTSYEPEEFINFVDFMTIGGEIAASDTGIRNIPSSVLDSKGNIEISGLFKQDFDLKKIEKIIIKINSEIHELTPDHTWTIKFEPKPEKIYNIKQIVLQYISGKRIEDYLFKNIRFSIYEEPEKKEEVTEQPVSTALEDTTTEKKEAGTILAIFPPLSTQGFEGQEIKAAVDTAAEVSEEIVEETQKPVKKIFEVNRCSINGEPAKSAELMSIKETDLFEGELTITGEISVNFKIEKIKLKINSTIYEADGTSDWSVTFKPTPGIIYQFVIYAQDFMEKKYYSSKFQNIKFIINQVRGEPQFVEDETEVKDTVPAEPKYKSGDIIGIFPPTGQFLTGHSAVEVQEDTIAPVITLTGEAEIIIEQGKVYSEPGYKAEDNIDGVITDKVEITGKVDTGTPGVYEIKYSVKDSNGIQAESKSRKITVTDKTAPVINLEENANITVGYGEPFTDPGYKATDNYDGIITSKVKVSGLVNTSQIGEYKLTYDVSDAAGNKAEQKIRTVTVADINPPEITLEGEDEITVTQFEVYEEPGYKAEDDLDGDLTSKVAVSGTVNTAEPGEYTVTYDVSDAAGNKAEQVIRKITVKEKEKTPVQKIKPENNSEISDFEPEFEWEAVPEANYYMFTVALNPYSSENIVIQKEIFSNEYKFNTDDAEQELQSEAEYLWTVIAYGNDGSIVSKIVENDFWTFRTPEKTDVTKEDTIIFSNLNFAGISAEQNSVIDISEEQVPDGKIEISFKVTVRADVVLKKVILEVNSAKYEFTNENIIKYSFSAEKDIDYIVKISAEISVENNNYTFEADNYSNAGFKLIENTVNLKSVKVYINDNSYDAEIDLSQPFTLPISFTDVYVGKHSVSEYSEKTDITYDDFKDDKVKISGRISSINFEYSFEPVEGEEFKVAIKAVDENDIEYSANILIDKFIFEGLTDEDLITKLIHNIQEAVKNEDNTFIIAGISEEFTGSFEGFTNYSEISTTLSNEKKRYTTESCVFTITNGPVVNGNYATVKTEYSRTVSFKGFSTGYKTRTISGEAEFELKKETDGWKIKNELSKIFFVKIYPTTPKRDGSLIIH